MITFKLRIDEIFKTLPSDGIIVLFFPKSKICPFYSIFPNSIGATSEPSHAFDSLFWIRKGNPKNNRYRVERTLRQNHCFGQHFLVQPYAFSIVHLDTSSI